MSVSELVSRLKSNIDSPDEVSEPEAAKTISKKDDPDKDIASMLKSFMQEEDELDFELDDASAEAETVDSDFELEADPDYEMELSIHVEDEVEEGEFEFEDEAESVGADFDEPEDEDIDVSLFEVTPMEVAIDVPQFEEESETEEAEDDFIEALASDDAPVIGASSLAMGFAKMLELSDDEIEPAISEKQISLGDIFDEETDEEAEEDISDMDMPELDEINPEVDEPEEAEEDVSPLYFLSNDITEPAPEEEYFAPEKKPLAFDDEDETPILPDVSAFEDVGRTDIASFDDALPMEELAEELDYEDEEVSSYEPPIISEGEELDDKDINLMIALGYEEEVEKAIGKKGIDEISEQLSAEMVDFIDIDNAYAFDGFELNSPDRFRSVGNKYKQEHATMKMRLLGTGIFALALFIFELLGAFGVTLGGALNIHHYPVVGIMLSLQLLVLAAALSWRQIITGLYDAVTFSPTPTSVASVAVLATVIYNIIMALIAPNNGLELYNFPAAICLMALVLGDYFKLSREIRAFNTVATRRPKYALTLPLEKESTAADIEEALSDEAPTEYAREKVLEAKKVGFIENYFRRTNIASDKDRGLCLVIYPILALAIALGIISFVTNKSGVTAFNISILTVLMGMPLSLVFNNSYTFFSAAKTSFESEAAIIGEASLGEYAGATSVVFHDKDIFPVDLTVTKGIKLYDNNAIYYVLYHLTSLYSKIGGPLKERLEQATTEMGHSDDVELIGVAQNGIEAVVDGKVRLLAGQAAYIEENGIFVPEDPDDARMIDDGCSVLYLALDGVLGAKLYVNYGITPELENIAADLAEEGMEAVIRTCDPNIDNDLLESKLSVSRFPARIIKSETLEENESNIKEAESGIVARNSLSALAHTVALCNKILRVRNTAKKASTAAMIISALLMALLAVFSSKLVIPSVYVVLYQLFWMIPLFLFTKLYVK